MGNPVLLTWCLGVDQGCGICPPSGPVDILVCGTFSEQSLTTYCVSNAELAALTGYYHRTLSTVYGIPNVLTEEDSLSIYSDGYTQFTKTYTYTNYGLVSKHPELRNTVCGQNVENFVNCQGYWGNPPGTITTSGSIYSDVMMAIWRIPSSQYLTS